MMIDNKWKLENFINRKDSAPSVKYGFIGLGQGGSKIADAFASIKDSAGNTIYPVMIVNSNKGDMVTLRNVPFSNQFGLKGYERGVGKNPEVGKQAFLENAAELFDEVARIMSGCEMVFVIASFGGGTGTGTINALVDAIADYLGIPVSAIITLPMPDEVESRNAHNALTELAPKLEEIRSGENGKYRALEALVIEDNQKIFEEHMSDPEVKDLTWDFYSNYKLAATLHEWNVVTSMPSDISLDAADVTNQVIMTGGVLTFSKRKLNLETGVRGSEDLIQQVINTYKGRNILANGFDYEKDTKAMAVCVVLPEKRRDMLNQDTVEQIRRELKSQIPGNVYVGYTFWGSEKHAIVYTMASMRGLPERAQQLGQEAQELYNARKEREKQSSGFRLGTKLNVEEEALSSRRPRLAGGNPFQKQTEGEAAAASSVDPSAAPARPKNPFRK